MPTLVARLPPLSLSPNLGLTAADSTIKAQRPKMDRLEAALMTLAEMTEVMSAGPTYRSMSWIVQVAEAVLK